MGRQLEDLGNKKIHRWLVISRAPNEGPHRSVTMWNCRCDCGTERPVRAMHLVRGTTKSCGCHNLEVIIRRNTRHGYSIRGKRHPMYNVWKNIIRRCYSKVSPFYPNYGGRGIKVCDRWRDNFAYFLEDMGERPFFRASIDRTDNNGDYSPENCRWANDEMQANNKRRHTYILFNNKRMTIAQAARAAGVHSGTIRSRIKYGISGEDLFYKGHLKTKWATTGVKA